MAAAAELGQTVNNKAAPQRWTTHAPHEQIVSAIRCTRMHTRVAQIVGQDVKYRTRRAGVPKVKVKVGVTATTRCTIRIGTHWRTRT